MELTTNPLGHQGRFVLLTSSRYSGANSASSPTTVSGHNFLTFLGIAQFYQVDFLPISWDFALSTASASGTAKIYESLLDASRDLVFKRTRILGLPNDKLTDESDEGRTYSALVAELSILCHPLLRTHPFIIKLVGISWEVSEVGDAVWPVMVIEKAQMGDLNHFMTTPMAEKLSFEGKVRLCADVASAVTALHAYNGAHGDIKPQNVFVTRDAEGKITAKMADFGYSFLANEGDEDVPFQPAESWPWNAPEHHHRKISIQQAQKQDVYSFGMLCFWVLFQAKITAKDPESASQIPHQHSANEQHLYSFRMLEEWKRKMRLQGVALEMTTQTISGKEGDILREFFRCSLAHEADKREKDFFRLEMLLNQICLDRICYQYPVLQPCPSLQSMYNNLWIMEMFFQFVEADSRIRRYLAHRLETYLHSISSGHLHYENTAFQLAFCYTLGFGAARQIEAAQHWVRESGRSLETLEKQIEVIKSVKAPRLFRSDHLRKLGQQGLLSNPTLANEYGSNESWEAAKPMLTREVHDFTSVLGDEHDAVITLRHRLSVLYQHHNLLKDAEAVEIEAIEALMNASHLPRFDLDPEHQKAMMTANFLQRPPPIIIQKPQLTNMSAVFRKISAFVNKASPNVTRSLYDLVSIYIRQQRWNEAEWLSVQLWEALESVLGKVHPDTIRSTYLIGIIYREQGRWKEAESIYRYNLEISKIVFGDSHWQTLQISEDLLQMYHHSYHRWKATEEPTRLLGTSLLKKSDYYEPERHGQLTDTTDLEKVSLEILLENPNMSVLKSIDNLVAQYRHQRRFEKAETLLLQLINLREKLLPKDHPLLLSHMESLGLLRMELKQLDEAESVMEKVFEKRSSVLGKFHAETLNVANNLAVIYMMLKKASKAEALLRETLLAQKVLLGENHPKTWVTMTNLAAACKRCGKPTAAIAVLEGLLPKQRECLGATHNQVVQATNHLGELYCEEQRAEDAEWLFRCLIARQEDEPEVDNPANLDSLLRLATALVLQNRLREATHLVERYHERTSQVFGETSRDALQSQNFLGIAYFREERWTEGEEVFRRLAASANAVLGPDDVLTKAAEINIKLGDEQKNRTS